MKARYSYFVQITEKIHKGVSAQEFKNLSIHWDSEEEKDGIKIYYIEADGIKIECGRRCRKY